MILIPEIETVVVLVPRTGSGSLRRAIAEKYPRSMLVYRHMEADGVPAGYDRWPKIGVVRDPVARLWSLYKFLRNFGGSQHDPKFVEAMRNSVRGAFGDWLLDNQVVFTCPYAADFRGSYFPGYTVRHPLPENRKSQFLYLRPDLGTQIYRYDQVNELEARLAVSLGRHNETHRSPPPTVSGAAEDYLWRVFAWDFSAVRK